MSWNHRVLAHKESDEDVVFAIHEVYYNDKGIPNGYTANAIRISSEDIEGLSWTIDKLKECLTKPVIWAGERFPEEYEHTK